ncbi:MAG TPA: hypothetical protein VF384_03385 [Planctomycetota bacterium]
MTIVVGFGGSAMSSAIVTSKQPLDLKIVLMLVAAIALLAVLMASRRIASRQTFSTICPGCGDPFEAYARVNFAGFRVLECQSCGVERLYPMPTLIVLVGWVIVLATSVAVPVAYLTDPKPKPPLAAVWVLILLCLLLHDQRLRRVLRVRAQQSDVSSGGRVASSDGMDSEPTVADMMAAYAQDAVDHARASVGVTLDFSPGSIEHVERILAQLHSSLPKGFLGKLRRRGPTQQDILKMAKMYGGYIGEVVRRAGGGEWTFDTEIAPGERILCLSKEGQRVWPVAKVHKRITAGSGDDVWLYVRMVMQDWK